MYFLTIFLAHNIKLRKSVKLEIFLCFRGGSPQPDNAEGVAEGPIDTEFDIGVTIEGLQEYHDEACLAVLNNRYGDGIAWHDVACHFRSVIICEDSDQLMNLVQNQEGVDVSTKVETNDKGVELDAIRLNEVEPELPHVRQQLILQQQQQQQAAQRHRPR